MSETFPEGEIVGEGEPLPPNPETDPDELPGIGELQPPVEQTVTEDPAETGLGSLDNPDPNSLDPALDEPVFNDDPEFVDAGPEAPADVDEGEEYDPSIPGDPDPDDVDDTVPTEPEYIGYELYGKNINGGEYTLLATIEPEQLSAELAGLPGGEDWVFKIRGILTDGSYGPFSAETQVNLPNDMEPPPKPSAPILTQELGVITIRWDGFGSAGEPMPADWDRTPLWMAYETVGPWTQIDVYRGPGETLRGNEVFGKNLYFRLTAFDKTGNQSVASDVSSIILTRSVDVDRIIETIDASKIRIDNAQEALLNDGKRLDESLTALDQALEQNEQNLYGPGGLTEQLAATEREVQAAQDKLADLANVVVEEGFTLGSKLTKLTVDLSSAEQELHGPGGLTERLTEAEGKLANAGDLTLPDGTTLQDALEAAERELQQTHEDLYGPGGLTEQLAENDAKLAALADLEIAEGLTLGQKLSTLTTDLDTAELELRGPGGLTERLAAAEALLAEAGDLTLPDGTSLADAIADSKAALAKLDTDLYGAGGLTDQLAANEAKLNSLGDLTVSDGGPSLDQVLADAARARQETANALANLDVNVAAQLNTINTELVTVNENYDGLAVKVGTDIPLAINAAAVSKITNDRLTPGSLTVWPFAPNTIPSGSLGGSELKDFSILVTKLKSDRHHLY